MTRPAGWDGSPLDLGQAMVIDGATAALAANALRRVFLDARSSGVTVDRRLLDLQEVAQRVGARWTSAALAEHQRNTGLPLDDECANVPPVTEIDCAETGRMLGIGPRAVRGLAARLSLPGRKVAGDWRFRLADVEEYARSRRERHAS